MLAISIASPEQAAHLVKDFALPFAILSDPRMDVIRAYGMKGVGENVEAIARAVREAKTPP